MYVANWFDQSPGSSVLIPSPIPRPLMGTGNEYFSTLIDILVVVVVGCLCCVISK